MIKSFSTCDGCGRVMTSGLDFEPGTRGPKVVELALHMHTLMQVCLPEEALDYGLSVFPLITLEV